MYLSAFDASHHRGVEFSHRGLSSKMAAFFGIVSLHAITETSQVGMDVQGVLGEPNIVPGGTISQPELHMKSKTKRAIGESIRENKEDINLIYVTPTLSVTDDCNVQRSHARTTHGHKIVATESIILTT